MQTLETILNNLLPIRTHQGEEENMYRAISSLIKSISFPEITPIEFNEKWGMYFKIESQSPKKNGILFLGHMDSDDHSESYSIENGSTNSNSKIGLDNKAGMSSILYALHKIKEQKLNFPFDIHVYFSVMEEVGQKGAMYFPIEKIAGRVRYALSVDRKTNAKGVRHFINSYHDVPMLIPGDGKFLESALGCKGVPSPNCADVIEIRGRHDAEFLYPKIKSDTDGNLKGYKLVTKKIKNIIEGQDNPLPPNQAVSSMRSAPRKDRYVEMRKIYDLLYSNENTIPEEYKLSVLNLSIDFEDPRITLKEISDTSDILLNFLEKYSAG